MFFAFCRDVPDRARAGRRPGAQRIAPRGRASFSTEQSGQASRTLLHRRFGRGGRVSIHGDTDPHKGEGFIDGPRPSRKQPGAHAAFIGAHA
ncbi:hypothetical protein LG3211_1697 [Lysobacter gummosus]|nr:hypothetical protein LG3211_1697 [Lysobacter gummosus]